MGKHGIFKCISYGVKKGMSVAKMMITQEIPVILLLGCGLPSGKRTKNYGKSTFLIGKLTINGHFQ